MNLVEEILASIKVLDIKDRIILWALIKSQVPMCRECGGEDGCNCCNDE